MTDTWGLVGPVPWTDELPVQVMIWTSYQEINEDSVTQVNQILCFLIECHLQVMFWSSHQAAICRSSQPLSGFSARCLEDEQMLEAMMKSNPGSQFMYVVDTRPKVMYLSYTIGWPDDPDVFFL